MQKLNKKHLLFLLLPLFLFFTNCDEDPDSPSLTNSKPTGSPGLGKTVLAGETVAFDGTASDPDADDVLTYQWSILSVPAGSAVSDSDIINPAALNASFTPDTAGDYIVQLTVSDGTDSVTGQATVRAVGYAVGLNDNTSDHAAYIHNGNFNPLPNPAAPTVDECRIFNTRLIEGDVYPVGGHRYSLASGNMQPVFWKNTTTTTVTGANENDIGIDIGVAPDGNVHMLTNYYSEVDDLHYWVQNTGYLLPASAVSAADPWDGYNITGLAQVGNDIYQYGIATGGEISSYFLAENLVEIIHSASFSPDPETDPDFVVRGTLIVPAVPESDSKVYLYGRYRQSDNYHAGYTVNGGSWADLADPGYVEGYNRYIEYMASVSDYILSEETLGVWSYKVFVDGSEYSMEVPYDGAADVTISSLEYYYMEEISGSVFVAGSYQYSDSMDNIYNTAAVWRDGKIVFEYFDDDPDDGLDYDSASIAGADFE